MGSHKSKLLTDTEKLYPFVKNNDIDITHDYRPGGSMGPIETYPIGETGPPDRPRPSDLPIDRNGIAIGSDAWPIDLAGDIFSHVDPYGQTAGMYMADSLTPKQMQEIQKQYLDYDETVRENAADVANRAKINGTSGLMRTAVFGQGGEGAVRGLGEFNFNVAQKNIVDKAKDYVKTGNAQPDGMRTIREYLLGAGK